MNFIVLKMLTHDRAKYLGLILSREVFVGHYRK
jgi:hypothetical protein